MAKERLFLALELPKSLTKRLLNLSFPSGHIRWLEAGQMHLTLRFLGETSTDDKRAIISAMRETASEHGSFSLDLRGVGVFPKPEYPKVMWVGVRANKSLKLLQKGIEQAITDLNYPPSEKEFHAHVTVARCRTPRNVKDTVQDWLREYKQESFGSLDVKEFHLYKSDTQPDGAKYTKLNTFELSSD
ncbi:MAG: RNA 2',3'-cyclic phosphodiesterase [Bacteroidota bacterium]